MGKKKEEYEGPELNVYREMEKEAQNVNTLILMGVTVMTFLSLLIYRC